MNPLISVIVPVYNVEKYLEKCLDSVINQTYKNLEIILIDDGSIDNSGKICDKYQESDDRIKVIHKENSGISSARNIGLKESTGDYFTFVDSDDWLDDSYFKTMIENKDEYDVIISGSRTIFNEKLIYECKLRYDKCIGNKQVRNKYFKSSTGLICPYCKLYNSKFKNVLFNENMPVGEDIVFNLNILKRVNSILYIEYIGYNIRKHINSTTNSISNKYTYMYEHDYKIIQNEIDKALLELGADNHYMESRAIKGSALRYFLELNNLFNLESPYSRKEIIKKIRIINSDREFNNLIKKANYKSLSNAGKLGKLYSKINNAYFTYFTFRIIKKLL